MPEDEKEDFRPERFFEDDENAFEVTKRVEGADETADKVSEKPEQQAE